MYCMVELGVLPAERVQALDSDTSFALIQQNVPKTIPMWQMIECNLLFKIALSIFRFESVLGS